MQTWKEIPGWPAYEASIYGEVRAKPRTKKMPGGRTCLAPAKILAQTIGGRAKNYKRVMLMNPKRHAYIHHLIAETFLGPRPDGQLVLHKDDNGFNNRLDNLRYGDGEENQMDRLVARIAPGMEAAPF